MWMWSLKTTNVLQVRPTDRFLLGHSLLHVVFDSYVYFFMFVPSKSFVLNLENQDMAPTTSTTVFMAVSPSCWLVLIPCWGVVIHASSQNKPMLETTEAIFF